MTPTPYHRRSAARFVDAVFGIILADSREEAIALAAVLIAEEEADFDDGTDLGEG